MRMRDEDGHQSMLEFAKGWREVKKQERKRWSFWTTKAGPALMRARAEAMAIAGTNQPHGRGYNEAMSDLLREYEVDDMGETTRAHVLKIMENLAAVEEWRAKQLQERRKKGRDTTLYLNNPSDVWTKYQRSAAQQDARDSDRAKRPNLAKQTAEELAAALQRISELEAHNAELEAARAAAADEPGAEAIKERDNVIARQQESLKELAEVLAGAEERLNLLKDAKAPGAEPEALTWQERIEQNIAALNAMPEDQRHYAFRDLVLFISGSVEFFGLVPKIDWVDPPKHQGAKPEADAKKSRGRKRKAKADATTEPRPTALTWKGDELVTSADAGDGQEYYLNATAFLGRGGVRDTGYQVHFMPVGTPESKMRDYKIGKAKTLEKAKTLAERHHLAKTS